MTTTGTATSGMPASEKRRLLAELLRKKAAENTTFAPLSIGQQALLFLHRANPESLDYNAVVAHRLTGAVNADALRSALQRIVDRHAILRTTYVMHDGDLVQRIHGARDVDFEVVDVAGASPEELKSRWEVDASRPYKLETDCSLRVRLYSRSADDHVFVLDIHHIGFDYWSLDVFCRELKSFYQSELTHTPSAVKPLRTQFADHTRAQNEMLAGPLGQQLWEYWQKEFPEGIPSVNLPVDRRRSSKHNTAGAVHSFEIPAETVAALRVVAQAQNTTVYVLFLAALQVLLHRYTRQDDVVVGSPLACRTSLESEELIGYFTNLLPLRANLSGDPPFPQFVEQIKKTLMGAFEHQEFPFALLAEKLGCRTDASQRSICDVGFAWETSHSRATETEGQSLNLELLYARQLGAPYDITVQAFEREQSISVMLVYNRELFEAATIHRFANHMCSLLAGIGAAPDTKVSMFPLITEQERRQLIEQWNDTATTYPREATLQQIFEDQVKSAPNAIAVQDGTESLTYGELNARANQLACHLRECGVQPRSLVGICAERSTEMVAALLGIVKCGAAYVPLDPAYPAERLAFMLQDTAVSVLVTQERQASSLPAFAGHIVYLDRDRDAIARGSRENVPVVNAADDLAYVMYTSGSTGTPKGIEITQRAIHRLVRHTNYIKLGPNDCVAQGANTSFDAATFEIWGALLNGARLVVIDKDAMLSPARLSAEVVRHEVTTIFLTTALFNQLAQHVPAVFSNFQNVLFGGEAVDPQAVARVLRDGKPRRLLHVYGPTETTTFATWHLVQEVPEEATTVPIGGPLANATTYVLDANRQPVPVGVPGELYIGGDGVARGYWKRSELTEERFVTDPFSKHQGARMYRSGDLVRRRADGAIEFLGRIDQQVKIRGFRIELEEIAATIRQQAGVHEALVKVLEEGGNKRLVAYVECKNITGRVSVSELRGHLRQRLPEYMVPAAFVILDKFPLNANGKIDHRALPPPSMEEEGAESYASPESDLERTIASIWANALGVERVGRFDNFFDLGGHSLLLARVHEKMQQAIGKSFRIVDIFRYPTISSIAAYLGKSGDDEHSFDDVRERARQQRLAKSRRVAVQAPRGRMNEQ